MPVGLVARASSAVEFWRRARLAGMLSGMPRSVRALIELLVGCEAVPIKMFLLALFA